MSKKHHALVGLSLLGSAGLLLALSRGKNLLEVHVTVNVSPTYYKSPKKNILGTEDLKKISE
ncbi:MAG: hypothetical protein ACK5MW_05365 [Enterococcus sp.]